MNRLYHLEGILAQRDDEVMFSLFQPQTPSKLQSQVDMPENCNQVDLKYATVFVALDNENMAL